MNWCERESLSVSIGAWILLAAAIWTKLAIRAAVFTFLTIIHQKMPGGETPKHRRKLSDNSFKLLHLFQIDATQEKINNSPRAVLRCSEPTNVISPRCHSTKSPETEIVEVFHMRSDTNDKLELDVKRKRSIKRLRRSLSKSRITGNRRKSKSIDDVQSRGTNSSKSSVCSANFSFEDSMIASVEIDPRITIEISLFYLQQQLPENFPPRLLEQWYKKYNSVATIQDMLLKRGWELKMPQPENTKQDCGFPAYYFGSWSYDCWDVFEGKEPGSYITCHKENRYYIMYKMPSGKVVLDIMSKGPFIVQSMVTKYKLTTGIIRPPKRYVCQKCGTKAPCEIAPPHPLVFQTFPITFPCEG